MRRIPTRIQVVFLIALLLPILWGLPVGAAKKKAGVEPALEGASSTTSAQAQMQLSLKYFSEGLLPQARQAIERALAEQPGYAEARYVFGLIALAQKDHATALSALAGALESNPFFTEAHNALGMTYDDMGQEPRALKEFKIVLSDLNYPTPEVPNFNIGRIYLKQGNFEAAAPYFKRACDANPQFGRACHQYAYCLEKAGRLREARESYEKALGGLPENLPGREQAYLRLGLVCYDLQDKTCACENLRKASDLGLPEEDEKTARGVLKRLEPCTSYTTIHGQGR